MNISKTSYDALNVTFTVWWGMWWILNSFFCGFSGNCSIASGFLILFIIALVFLIGSRVMSMEKNPRIFLANKIWFVVCMLSILTYLAYYFLIDPAKFMFFVSNIF